MAGRSSLRRKGLCLAAGILCLAAAPAAGEERDPRALAWREPDALALRVLRAAFAEADLPPPPGGFGDALPAIRALPAEKRARFLDAAVETIRGLPEETRAAGLSAFLGRFPGAWYLGEREGLLEIFTDRYAKGPAAERAPILEGLARLGSPKAFEAILAVLADPKEGAETRPAAARSAAGFLLVREPRPALPPEAIRRLGALLFSKDVPGAAREEFARRLMDAAALPAAARDPSDADRLLESADLGTRRLGTLLGLKLLGDTGVAANPDAVFRRIPGEAGLRPLLALAGPEARVRLLERVDDFLLASALGLFLDDPRVTGEETLAVAARALDEMDPIWKALRHPPEPRGGARTALGEAAWTAAGVLAGIPESEKEALAALDAPSAEEGKALLRLLAGATPWPPPAPASVSARVREILGDPEKDPEAFAKALAAISPAAGSPAPDPFAAGAPPEEAAPVLEAEALSLAEGAEIGDLPGAGGGRAAVLSRAESRISGEVALSAGVWTLQVEGFAGGPDSDAIQFRIGEEDFRIVFQEGWTTHVLDLLVTKPGKYPFSIRTDEPGVVVDRILAEQSDIPRARFLDMYRRLPARKADPKKRHRGLRPRGSQMGILGPAPAEGTDVAAPPAPPRGADRAEAIRRALEAAKGRGEVLWSREDPDDSDALWVSAKGKFVTLCRLSGDAPEDFSTFVEMAIGDAVTASAAAFAKDAVWMATDRGLFRWTRASRGWDVVPVGKEATLGAEVAGLDLKPDGTLEVRLKDGSAAIRKPDGTW